MTLDDILEIVTQTIGRYDTRPELLQSWRITKADLFY